MKSPKLWAGLLAVATGAVGFCAGISLGPAEPSSSATTAAASAAPSTWICSMCPSIRMPEPTGCPICGMDLIELDGGAADGAAPRLALSESARRRIRVETTEVERRWVESEVRMFGKIHYDETRLVYVAARIPGRIERLYVDYDGVEVAEGDPMAVFYSPHLYSDQATLLSALSSVRSLNSSAPQLILDRTYAALEAAREHLREIGLTEDQISDIENANEASNYITIVSPIDGVVVHEEAQQGQYLDEGAPIYTIADLSHLWVLLDAYESDLYWLHYGQKVDFTTEAYPGEVFSGSIAYLSRELDSRTHTVEVRVNIDNPDNRLKPGMFVRAVVGTSLAAGGRVIDPELGGKWICAIHPEIVADAPGSCARCDMRLVPTSTLGIGRTDDLEMPLVVPVTAPLVTGRRAVVYIELETEEGVEYEGREVRLGPRAGDWYVVDAGLSEGERVVTHGSFKIDSALQIRARRSMMSASSFDEPAPVPRGHPVPRAVWDGYLAMGDALCLDHDARAGLADLREALAAAPVPADPAGKRAWEEFRTTLTRTLDEMERTDDVEEQRGVFERFSIALTGAIRTFGLRSSAFVFECPMAFERGAQWLADTQDLENPYMGQRMLECGRLEGPAAGAFEGGR